LLRIGKDGVDIPVYPFIPRGYPEGIEIAVIAQGGAEGNMNIEGTIPLSGSLGALPVH
jgi:hypothetical protein